MISLTISDNCKGSFRMFDTREKSFDHHEIRIENRDLYVRSTQVYDKVDGNTDQYASLSTFLYIIT